MTDEQSSTVCQLKVSVLLAYDESLDKLKTGWWIGRLSNRIWFLCAIAPLSVSIDDRSYEALMSKFEQY